MNSDVFFSVTNIRTNVQNDSSEFEGLLHEMVSQKPFINQEICHINLNSEKSICTVSKYRKEFLSIVEIENKKCQRCSKLKPTVEVISYKLIMFLEGLPTSNYPRQIDNPRCDILTKDTVFKNAMLQKYFKYSFLDDVICENCSAVGTESIKLTFTMSR